MYKTACGNGFPLNIPSEINGGGGGGGASSADDVSYDNTSSGLTATDVQAAIDEVAGDVSDLETELEGVTPNIYSTTETVVGKWNNSDLYRKIVNVGSLPNNINAGTDSGITNLGEVVSMRGYAKDSASIINLPYASPTASDSISVWYDIASNKIYVNTKNDKSNFTGYIVIEYTKVLTQTNKGGKK